MKIAVVGPSHRAAICLMQMALNIDYEVLALCNRGDLSKLGNINDPKFQKWVLKNDDDVGLEKALEGCECVVIGQGLHEQKISVHDLITITGIMRKQSIKRLIILDECRKTASKCLLRCSSCRSSGQTMEHYIEDTCDDLDWTLVRTPPLVDQTHISGSCFAQEGRMVPGNTKLPFMNAADFLCEQVTETTWHRRSVYIMRPKPAISI